jgi:hypothetical protein
VRRLPTPRPQCSASTSIVARDLAFEILEMP